MMSPACNIRRGVWVPAFAGTTDGEISAQRHYNSNPAPHKFITPRRAAWATASVRPVASSLSSREPT